MERKKRNRQKPARTNGHFVCTEKTINGNHIHKLQFYLSLLQGRAGRQLLLPSGEWPGQCTGVTHTLLVLSPSVSFWQWLSPESGWLRQAKSCWPLAVIWSWHAHIRRLNTLYFKVLSSMTVALVFVPLCCIEHNLISLPTDNFAKKKLHKSHICKIVYVVACVCVCLLVLSLAVNFLVV